MFTKKFRSVLFLGLFLHFAGTPAIIDTPAFANDPLITGITIDEELTQLLSQIKSPQGRFLFNLNKLINEDLAAQDEKYKLAACKLALRQALAINKTVDSIEVRRYRFPFEGGYDNEKNYGLDVKGNFQWVLGGTLEDRAKWDDMNPTNGNMTNHLFTVQDGKITHVNVSISVDACGGSFSDCCDRSAFPPGMDDAWLQHFVDIGRLEGWSFREPDAIAKLVNMGLKNGATIEVLSFRQRYSAEGIADLAKLKTLKHLIIDTTESQSQKEPRETEAMREAFFDLFSQLPNLETIEMITGPVTESQMQKLAECKKLKNLTLTGFSVETPQSLALINRLKNLEKLALSSGFSFFEEEAGNRFLNGKVNGTAPPHAYFQRFHKAVELGIKNGKSTQEKIEFHDLPNLTFFYAVGIAQEHPFSFVNIPRLQLLVTDTSQVQGDIFTAHLPPDLKVLVCSGRGITREQIRYLSLLEHLNVLGLYALEPEDMDMFSSLENAKKLQWLALTFTKDGTLTSPALHLGALIVRFYESGKLRIPSGGFFCHALDVEDVTFVDEIPWYNWIYVSCRNTTMSYTQFQSFFQNQVAYGGGRLNFDDLMLTDIKGDILFTGFTFPESVYVRFSPAMRESLKGKTFDYGEGKKMSRGKYTNVMKLTVPHLQEVHISPPGLADAPPSGWEFKQIE